MAIPYLHTAETKLMLQVKKDLSRHEAFREYAYPDPLSPMGKKYRGWNWGKVAARELLGRIAGFKVEDGNPWTYGYGFTHNVTCDSRIQPVAAERQLESLILEMNLVLGETFSWYKASSFITKTILINMAFNMGLSKLKGFKNTLEFIRKNDYENAARNMQLSLWYTQTGSRARELVERMRTQTIEPQYKAGDTING